MKVNKQKMGETSKSKLRNLTCLVMKTDDDEECGHRFSPTQDIWSMHSSATQVYNEIELQVKGSDLLYILSLGSHCTHFLFPVYTACFNLQ